jgi:hypothetical protein
MIAVGWIHDRHREIARPWVHLNKVVGARGSPDDSNGERGASAAAASAVRAPRVGDVKYRHITYTSLAPRAGKRLLQDLLEITRLTVNGNEDVLGIGRGM